VSLRHRTPSAWPLALPPTARHACDALAPLLRPEPPPFEWVVRYAQDGRLSRTAWHRCDDVMALLALVARYATLGERTLFLLDVIADAARYTGAARLAPYVAAARAAAATDWAARPSRDAIQTALYDLKVRWSGDARAGLAAALLQLWKRDSLTAYEVEMIYNNAMNVVPYHAQLECQTLGQEDCRVLFERVSRGAHRRYARMLRRRFPAPRLEQVVRA